MKIVNDIVHPNKNFKFVHCIFYNNNYLEKDEIDKFLWINFDLLQKFLSTNFNFELMFFHLPDYFMDIKFKDQINNLKNESNKKVAEFEIKVDRLKTENNEMKKEIEEMKEVNYKLIEKIEGMNEVNCKLNEEIEVLKKENFKIIRESQENQENLDKVKEEMEEMKQQIKLLAEKKN